MYAYAHAPLVEKTIKLPSFSSDDKIYAFIKGFYGWKELPNFFTKQMYKFFQKLIVHVFAWVYIDDINYSLIPKRAWSNLSNNSTKFAKPMILNLLQKNHSTYSSLSNFLNMKLAIKQLNPYTLKLMEFKI